MVEITYFVHGTTTDNEAGIATGWRPGELSETGLRQAKELGVTIPEQHFDAVFCSDLQRAVDSARLMFGENYKIIQDDLLRECNYGSMNGLPHTFKDRLEDYVDNPFPEGESFRDVEVRLESFVEYIREHFEGKHIAVVAHQAPQLALEVILGGKSWHEAIKSDWRRRGAWRPGWEYIA